MTRMQRLTRIAAAAALIAAGTAAAADYPSKPIRLVVPFSPGGSTDVLGRLIAQRLGTVLGTTVIVDNRPGAGGNLGSDVVAKSEPDGYTLLLGTVSTHAINVSIYKKMPYEPMGDFAPVALLASVPNVLVVHPKVPASSVEELIRYAKANPGKLAFASSGNGTSIHLSGEMLKSLAGVDMLHVPYKGAGPALSDLIGGQVQLMFDNLPSALPHVKGGRLRALAVTSTRRNPAVPSLPTMVEAGVKGFDAVAWFGVLAPARTPPAIVQRLNAEITKLLTQPDLLERFATLGAEPAASNTPEQFAAFMKSEIARWAVVAKASGAQVD